MLPLVTRLLLPAMLLACSAGCSDSSSTFNSSADSWVPNDRDLVLGSSSNLPGSSDSFAKPDSGKTEPDRLIGQARAAIVRGQLTSNPQHFGRAEALLASLDNGESRAQVYVLKATLLQRRHDFAAALQQLSLALEQQPRNPQAWLSQALIQRASGELLAAANSCRHLRPLTQAVISLSCEVAVASDMASPSRQLKALHYLLDRNPPADVSSGQWAHRTAAAAAHARGQTELAEHHFARALELTPDAPAVHAEWIDFLLDQQRLQQAESHLQGLDTVSSDNGLLLRRAIISRQLGSELWHRDLTLLQQRQALLQQRGEGSLHLREQARQALELELQPEHALTLALHNWQLQREVADARLVLQAALQARQPSAAAPVTGWMEGQRIQHPLLQQLASQLEAPAWPL